MDFALQRIQNFGKTPEEKAVAAADAADKKKRSVVIDGAAAEKRAIEQWPGLRFRLAAFNRLVRGSTHHVFMHERILIFTANSGSLHRSRRAVWASRRGGR